MQPLTYHTSKAGSPQKGVAAVPKALPDSFKGVDPLSRAGEQANKPGSSIPTIFARMIFFHTSFKSIDPSTVGGVQGTSPVYNQVVSQCFDLLERIFNRDKSLEFVEWDPTDQVEKLRATKHDEIADALSSHFSKFIECYGAQKLYLILEKDENTNTRKVIGGTSPYTIVFTSPNWSSGRTVTPLLDRDPKFKEYIYRVYAAFRNDIPQGSDPAKATAGFMDYVEKTVRIDPDRTLRALAYDTSYTSPELIQDFPPVKVNHTDILVAAYDLGITKMSKDGIPYTTSDIYLSTRKQGVMKSDFFVDSDLIEFNEKTTPLILAKGTYHSRFYHDTVKWNDSTDVPQDENINEMVRPLPNADGIDFLYYTTIDFLEEKLIQLPYAIDENNFFSAINVDEKGYLLPVKPRLLQYFSKDKIKEIMKVEHDGHAGKIKVTLSIPVRNNAGLKIGTIDLSREYNLDSDVMRLTANPVSVGFAPFFRLVGTSGTRHTVVYQYSPFTNKTVTGLKFYNFGSAKELKDVDLQKRGKSTTSEVYKLNEPFDALRVNFEDESSFVAGIVIPNFEVKNSMGAGQYYYSIDFGTTNSHIAMIARGAASARSFGSDEIREQVTYLAAVPQKVTNAMAQKQLDLAHEYMKNVYGLRGINIKMAQERMFYPNFKDEEYTFPIRTVMGQNGVIDQFSELFSNASVGFRFTKEFNPPAEEEIAYKTDVKWSLENAGGAEARYRASLFFRELLEMIRVDWLNQPAVDFNNPPVIVLTYPLAMNNMTAVMRLWYAEYTKVFGVDQKVAMRKILKVAESLAPAYCLISTGKLPVHGILNVDIGGGTTDIQYYRVAGANKYAFYNSVRFAGDDLWGTGYENVPGAPGQAVQDNIFIDFAKEKLNDVNLVIDMDTCKVENITKKGKEFINVLLRDSQNQFMDALTSPEMNMPRKVLFIHYSAIIYHIVKLLKSQPEMTDGMFPATLNFTGFGSKYIAALFGDDHIDKLILFTRELIKAYGYGEDNIPKNFHIVFASNPKAATAEGAALYAQSKDAGTANALTPSTVRHYGFDGQDSNTPLVYRDLSSRKSEVMQSYKEFIQGLQSINLADLAVPHLSDAELDRLGINASASYDTMVASTADPGDVEGQKQINDSLLFWTLKGSLFNL